MLQNLGITQSVGLETKNYLSNIHKSVSMGVSYTDTHWLVLTLSLQTVVVMLFHTALNLDSTGYSVANAPEFVSMIHNWSRPGGVVDL